MPLWSNEQATDHWWCDRRIEAGAGCRDLAGLFFDIAYRQRDPRSRARFTGFPNAVEFSFALAQSYTATDWPCEREDRDFWVAAFRSVGFLRDGVQDEAARPSAPLVLYRAAGFRDAAERPGLSWSSSRGTAEWFARYNDERGHPSYVFRAEVRPDQLLARLSRAVVPTEVPSPPEGDQWIADVDGIQLS